MIIDVPVYIAMDHDGKNMGGPYYPRPQIEARFVVRIDTDDDSKPIQFAKKYGSTVGKFYEDTADIFALAFDTNDYRKLIERAKANPVDYCSDSDEGERLQEIADAARRPAWPSPHQERE